jgi:hypothetical protein
VENRSFERSSIQAWRVHPKVYHGSDRDGMVDGSAQVRPDRKDYLLTAIARF